MEKCKIKSVRSLGIHPTYNIAMEGDQHNYKVITSSGAGIYTKNSHACAYAFIAYQTAWLKLYYPLEFMCNLLSSELDSSDKDKIKMKSYYDQATRMGLVIKQTDLNKSKRKFSIEDGKRMKEGKGYKIGDDYEFIREPLTVLKGLGNKASDEILVKQPFKNLHDFIFRVDLSKVDVKIFESLVNKNCMEECWGISNHEKIMETYHVLREEVEKEKKSIKKEAANLKLFGGSLFDDLGNSQISL